MADPDESRVISIAISHGQGHLWNAIDVHHARTSFRIVGHMVGSLPRHPHQSSMLGLPLWLMPEEVTLLLEKGFGKAVSYKEALQCPSSQIVDIYNKMRAKSYNEQILAAAKQRKQEIERVADIILEGKLKKLQKQAKNNPSGSQETNFGLSREKVIEMECEKIPVLPEHQHVIQIFTEHPMIDDVPSREVQWSIPSNVIDKLRYAVYKDLWEKDYYITSGIKFGGDFLVYKGDPILYHASFIVKCVQDMNLVGKCDLMTLARLGNSTKKSVVFAFLGSDRVQYKSFQLVEDESS
ncbi:tRNA-splicing endonuclease subunit Sen34 [Halocaridina rubra]|uniref:tRNA-splicing endonuclease subunit Sen34 n=1 Tax=Halocaridina rubra TaxID=373956 RepID=A0AAN8ZXR5_HALRR